MGLVPLLSSLAMEYVTEQVNTQTNNTTANKSSQVVAYHDDIFLFLLQHQLKKLSDVKS